MTSTLNVTVKYDPLTCTAKVEPYQISLSPEVRHVVWSCDLLLGGSLEIQFDTDGTGPFQRLEPSGGCIVGSGNVGRRRQVQYPYQIRVQVAGVECIASGVVVNAVTAAEGSPAPGPMLMLKPRLPEGPPTGRI
jgi:hypothetical protein